MFGASSDASVRVTFDRASDGRVTGATLLQRDQTYKGPRRP